MLGSLQMHKLTLFHTDGCHLCENALELIKQAGLDSDLLMRDIVEEESLMAEYQTLIPVVEFSSGAKLLWPFTLEDIQKTINHGFN